MAEEENWDNNFEGDLTVNTSLQLTDTDPLQTIRPYSAKKSSPEENDDLRRRPSQDRTPSGSSKPRPPSPNKAQALHKQLLLPSRPTALFREDSIEDYSDLFATNDAVFDRKVGALKVSLHGRSSLPHERR